MDGTGAAPEAEDLRDRRPAVLVSPRYEDAGLFKDDICRIEVDLTPAMSRNSRKDIIVTGYAGGRHKVPVIFAGRRSSEAYPLLQALSRLSEESGGSPNTRLTVEVEGAWRRIVRADPSGFARRRYAFMAASWSLPTPGGRVEEFGVHPAI